MCISSARDCYINEGSGFDYQGNVSVTASGKTCAPWRDSTYRWVTYHKIMWITYFIHITQTMYIINAYIHCYRGMAVCICIGNVVHINLIIIITGHPMYKIVTEGTTNADYSLNLFISPS